MTEQERAVIDKLVEAHELYILLSVQHPNDLAEWIDKLHELQRIVMAREAVRNNPSYFYNTDIPE